MPEPISAQNYFPISLSLRDFYYTVFRHKKKIFLFFFFVLFAVTIVTFNASEIYRSEAKLLVKLGQENVSLDPAVGTRPVGGDRESQENAINSELEILRSRELAENVVNQLGVNSFLESQNKTINTDNSLIDKFRGAINKSLGFPSDSPPDPSANAKRYEGAVRSLMQNLSVEVIRKTNIIALSYKAKSPQFAQDVLSAVISFYLDKHIRVYQTPGSYQFFNQQTEELLTALAKTEKELNDLKNKAGIASLEEQRRILLQHLGSVQREIQDTDSALAASAAKVKKLQTAITNLPETIVGEETTSFAGSTTEDLRQHLGELKLKEKQLLSTFPETSVQVTEIRRQISVAETLLRRATQTRQVKKAVNVNRQQLEMALLTEEGNLSSLQAKSEILKKQLAKLDEELKILNDTELRLAQLERQSEIQKANYKKYSENLEQARIGNALDMEKISNISVAEPPTYSLESVGSHKRLKLALGLFLGLVGSLGLSFFSEYFDHSFKKPEDIQKRLELPVLATIPVGDTVSKLINRKDSKLSLLPENRGDIKLEGYADPAESKKFPMATEKSLLTFPWEGKEAAQIMSITSCYRGEGVSTIAVSLALTLAYQRKGRVLLVDVNFGDPDLHRYFGTEPSPGLAEVLMERHSYMASIRPSSIDNLDLLFTGQNIVDLSPFTDTKAFADLLGFWKREYSFVIFDSPPLEVGRQALSLGSRVNVVILVIEAEKVRWEVARRAKEHLQKVNANIEGVILNKRRFYIPQWLYRTL